LTLLAAGKVGRRRVGRTLRRWRQDPNLASLRDKPALAQLPVEERQACQRLWADVQALLKRSEGASKESRP
jgi:hypothetical protein